MCSIGIFLGLEWLGGRDVQHWYLSGSLSGSGGSSGLNCVGGDPMIGVCIR